MDPSALCFCCCTQDYSQDYSCYANLKIIHVMQTAVRPFSPLHSILDRPQFMDSFFFRRNLVVSSFFLSDQGCLYQPGLLVTMGQSPLRDTASGRTTVLWHIHSLNVMT